MYEIKNDNLESETAMIFNDVTLAMIIIVLLYASIFATLVTSTKILQSSSQSQETDTVETKPTEQTSLSYFGEAGFPQGQKEKGFPTKNNFNQDLVITNNETIRPGVIGNKEWNFEYLDGVQEQLHITIYVDKKGVLTYNDRTSNLEQMQDEINRKSKDHHVFVKIVIDENAPMHVYQNVRANLWNESNAIHWDFTTDFLEYTTPELNE